MDNQKQISALLARLHGANPSGFAIALHIRFTSPQYLFQSYAKEWIDLYSRKGLVLHDPTVHWGFANTGAIRWSDLLPQDEHGVMALAAEHGNKFGVCASLFQDGSRSIASFTRADRELTDDEMLGCQADLQNLHRLTQGVETFSPDVHAMLKQLSIYLTHG
ncbi:MAG: autoinducer binding domain-containing protein [Albidovulum sp.]